MENVADALYMSAAVLLLLVALSVSIYSFTSIKMQLQDMIETDESAVYAKEGNNYLNFFKSESIRSCRLVGVESVITTIRRIRHENYDVYINSSNMSYFKDISPENPIWGEDNKQYLKITISGKDSQKQLNDDNMHKLYNCIYNKTFEEFIGIYREYKENVPDADNKLYRVIVYREKV